MNSTGQQSARRLELEARFAGVTDPESMGTSGLVAWAIAGRGARHGGRGRWDRFRRATSIIRARGLDVGRFRSQVVREALAYNAWIGEAFARYERAARKAGR